MGGGDPKKLRQARDGRVGEVADRIDAFAVENRPGAAAHSPQGPHGEAVEEFDRGLVRNEQQAIGFCVRGGDLRNRLGRGDADGGGKANAVADARADEGRDLERRSEAPPRPGHVEKGLVDGDLLQRGSDCREDPHYFL